MSEPENPKLLDLQFETTSTGTDITLRDLFAAAALNGIVAGITALDEDRPEGGVGIIRNRPQDCAEIAYTYADAMLAERSKR